MRTVTEFLKASFKELTRFLTARMSLHSNNSTQSKGVLACSSWSPAQTVPRMAMERREQVLARAALQGEEGSVLLKRSSKSSPSRQPAGYCNGEDVDTRRPR